MSDLGAGRSGSSSSLTGNWLRNSKRFLIAFRHLAGEKICTRKRARRVIGYTRTRTIRGNSSLRVKRDRGWHRLDVLLCKRLLTGRCSILSCRSCALGEKRELRSRADRTVIATPGYSDSQDEGNDPGHVVNSDTYVIGMAGAGVDPMSPTSRHPLPDLSAQH